MFFGCSSASPGPIGWRDLLATVELSDKDSSGELEFVGNSVWTWGFDGTASCGLVTGNSCSAADGLS